MNPTTYFYSELPVFEDGLINHLSYSNRFQKVPHDWHVIITDIKGSTKAIKKGLHQQVNLTATASIISALNIARDKGISFPFFFGGDGATLLIPDIIREEVLAALSVYQRNVKQAFKLNLRVDGVPVSKLYDENQSLTISKIKISSEYTIPVILGEGLLFADELIKQKRFKFKREVDKSALNLEGMECRWDAVKPPEKTKQVVCLLLKTQPRVDQSVIFGKVLKMIEDVYGSYEMRRPISIAALKLVASLDRFKSTDKLRFGNLSTKRLAKSVVGYAVGKVFLKREAGKNYLKNLVELSETLVMNGMLNTIISGTEEQRIKLEAKLVDLEKKGEIIFGMSISDESIMSCYVQDRINNHVHFIDGSEGGYTAAASVLKKKMALQKKG